MTVVKVILWLQFAGLTLTSLADRANAVSAAIVNGQSISMAQLTEQACLARGDDAEHQLIDEALIDQAGRKWRVTVDLRDIDAKIASIRQGLPQGETLENNLASRGISMRWFRNNVRYQIELEKLVGVVPQPTTNTRHVWNLTVATVYQDRQTGQLKQRTDDDALRIIATARSQLAQGVPFAKLTKRYDDYSSNREVGGDLGLLYDHLDYMSDLFPVASKLGPGEWSKEVVRTGAGYHLIYVSSTAQSHPAGEDALYREADKQYRDYQIDEAMTPFVTKLREAATIRIYSHDGASTEAAYVVATVNDQDISIDAVRDRALELTGPAILRHMIESTIIDQAARKKNIVVTQSEIDAKRTAAIARLGGRTLDSELRRAGMTMQQFEDGLTDQIKLERLVNHTPEPAKKLRHIWHIAIAARDAGTSSRLSRDSSKEEALRKLSMIKLMLKSGANVADLAQRYSSDLINPGGDLGIVHAETNINRDIVKVALSLKNGEISKPFKSFFGYEFVYVSSTDTDHPKEEDPMYSAARERYRVEQLDRRIGPIQHALDSAAKVTIDFRPDEH